MKQRKRPAADVEVIRAGSRYVWGRGRDFYGIWDQQHPDDPIATFDGSSRSDGWRYFQELEWEAKPIKPRHRLGHWIGRSLLVLLAFVVVALLGVIGFLLASNRTLEGSIFDLTNEAASGGETGAQPTVFVRHENVDGGYAFRYPSSWVPVDGSTGTELSSVDAGVTLAFAVTSERRIAVAAESIVRSLTGGWTDVEREPRHPRTVGAFDAVSVSGTGTDEAGRQIRFLVVAIDGGDRNFTIRVLVPREFDAAAVLPGVEEVVASFEPL